METINFDKALISSSERIFSIGNDMVMIDDVTTSDIADRSMQLGFFLIGLCREGEASFKLGGKQLQVHKGDLIVQLGDQVIENMHSADNFHATFVLMTRRFAQDCVVGLDYMWPYLLYIIKNPVVQLSEEEQTWIWDCYTLLHDRAHKKPGRYMREAVIALTRAFYFEVCNLLDSRAKPERAASQSRSYAIFDQFIRLVSQNFKHERGVEWYSNEMCITPKYLSEVVKSVSGRTAGQWITSLVMIEIKTLLQNSALSIKEIAQEMNFPNQSFFGKYFKNLEGVSPTDFRKIGKTHVDE